MAHQNDVGQVPPDDVGGDRLGAIVQGDSADVDFGSAAAAGQVNGQDIAIEQRDQPAPAAGAHGGAVNQHERLRSAPHVAPAID
jgi:hypothetical protein